MKARAEELRAEGKKCAKKADDLQAALDSIAQMAADDRALAERVHATRTANAAELSPRTWYGMLAYANAADKTVVALKNSGKFGRLIQPPGSGTDAVVPVGVAGVAVGAACGPAEETLA
jgi:hypothetical protein